MARCRGAVFVSCQRNRAGLPCTQNPAGRCGHRPLRRMIDPVRRAEVRQKSQPRPGGYIIRPYMHAPPFPVVGACIFVLNIPLPYSLLPITSHKKTDLQKSKSVFLCWRYLSSRAVTRKVLSAKVSLTSVFGMGTGGPSPQSTPTSSRQIPYPSLRRKRQSSVIPLSLLSKSQTLRRFVILSFRMYPEN